MRERTRPPLSDEQVSEEALEHDGETFTVEAHTFASVPFSPSDVLAAEIKNGNVTKSTRNVEFWINRPSDESYDGDKATKVYRQSLTEVRAKNEQGSLSLPGIDGDSSKIWEAASALSNRNTFQNVYVDMRNAASGPEKAVKRVQKLFAGLSPAQLEAAKAALAEAGLL